jgi:PDZ domain-containing secreted protein
MFALTRRNRGLVVWIIRIHAIALVFVLMAMVFEYPYLLFEPGEAVFKVYELLFEFH